MNDIRRTVAQGISPLYEMGVKDEYERIIALLKEDDRAVYENGECQLDNHWPEMCNCRVIALIKGKNE